MTAPAETAEDIEFWNRVFTDGPEVEETGEPPEPWSDLPVTPCEVCGSREAACGYDDTGRPMIHTTPPEEES